MDSSTLPIENAIVATPKIINRTKLNLCSNFFTGSTCPSASLLSSDSFSSKSNFATFHCISPTLLLTR